MCAWTISRVSTIRAGSMGISHTHHTGGRHSCTRSLTYEAEQICTIDMRRAVFLDSVQLRGARSRRDASALGMRVDLLIKEPNLTPRRCRKDGHPHPKCELRHSDDRKTNCDGSLLQRHGVRPTIALSGNEYRAADEQEKNSDLMVNTICARRVHPTNTARETHDVFSQLFSWNVRNMMRFAVPECHTYN